MTEAPAGTAVAVMAEGKQHAMAVGVLALSTADMFVIKLFKCCLSRSFQSVQEQGDWN